MTKIAPFGSWKSPISSEIVAGKTIGFQEMHATKEALYWLEGRPNEQGRVVLIKYDGKETELLPNVSVRTRVHEYGGGALSTFQGKLIYCNDKDGQLYELNSNHPLTKEPHYRYADGNGSIWVGEKHNKNVENCLVTLSGEVLASGHDFYSSPRLSPDGKTLAYITWDFPNMQWDSSTLWLAQLGEDGKLHQTKHIAGGADESVFQVQFSPDGLLHYVSDKTGFWNLYRYQNEKSENLCPMDAEFAIPGWVFGLPTYTFLQDGSIICAYTIKGIDYLGKLDPNTKTLTNLHCPFTSIQNLVTFQNNVYFFGASPTTPKSIICYNPKTNAYTTIKETFRTPLTEEWISEGKLIEFPTQKGETSYAFYYPPKNPHYQPPNDELPPLIVRIHGGPTARSYHQLMLETQFWTTRGFGVCDVNYGGSTGFGRKYFKRLEGNWGIVDVEDAINAAKFLVEKKLADPKKLLIRGGSAGGYTTLMALASHHIFAGGTSLYGVSDVELLCKDTHKFESKYTDLLIAPYPEKIDLIRARSPITHIDKISTPILLLQGEEDKVVPPSQSFVIFEALKKKNIPTGMLLFEGESHGFRKSPSIKQALDAELYFYSKILNFELAEPFDKPPVEIFNT